MELQALFPVWDKLSDTQQNRILGSLTCRDIQKGTVIHNGSMDCTGLLLVKSGQLRAYILSDEGREITLYRLFDRDICLFSASCMLRSVQFDITIEAEKDTSLWIVPRTGGQLHQRAHGRPVFRGHVADGTGHVEEHGQTDRRLSAGGSGHRRDGAAVAHP